MPPALLRVCLQDLQVTGPSLLYASFSLGVQYIFCLTVIFFLLSDVACIAPVRGNRSRSRGSKRPEPHILLFRRPLGTNPVTGRVDPELEREAKEKYAEELSDGIRK